MVLEHWIERADACLFVAEQGTGTPLVLVHGGLANHQACVRLAGSLPSRVRLITPDLRGSGRSVFAGPLDWDLLADDLAAVLRVLGISRAVIGGVSFGAGCAVRFALRHRAMTAALLVLNPAFAGADVGLTPAQMAAMRAMAEAGQRALVSGVSALYPLLETLPVEMRERARATVAGYDPASVAATTAFMASGSQPFERADDVARIDCPTLVVPGVDATHPPEVTAVYAKHIPRCSVVEMTDYERAIGEFMSTVIG